MIRRAEHVYTDAVKTLRPRKRNTARIEYRVEEAFAGGFQVTAWAIGGEASSPMYVLETFPDKTAADAYAASCNQTMQGES